MEGGAAPGLERGGGQVEVRALGYRRELGILGSCGLGHLKYCLRPPSSKKLFPVGQVGKKNASREVGIFLFFPNFKFFLN